ncbi:SHOCT domain-containing protein [Amnibacterium endophyticum]|uniref:SHOCT domain-containing protein n=1 Tax=Amnibacterium endophyticum TaxID=2109337 RepID=A0ABW4LF59_9MICO
MPGDLGPDPFPAGVSHAAFVVVPAIIGIVFLLIVVSIVYRSVRLGRRGVNPLTLQEDLAARALRSQALAPARSKAERLAELDRLHADGAITDAERADARDRILAE